VDSKNVLLLCIDTDSGRVKGGVLNESDFLTLPSIYVGIEDRNTFGRMKVGTCNTTNYERQRSTCNTTNYERQRSWMLGVKCCY
jgi:hypothetical protein